MDKKRHKRKELLSLLVCVLMLTGMIAGCIPQSEISADAGTTAANDTSSVATTIAEAADSVLGGAGLKEQAAASESTTQDTAISAGESAVLNGKAMRSKRRTSRNGLELLLYGRKAKLCGYFYWQK